MLQLQDVKKTYKTKAGDVHALDGVSLTFPEKGLVFITGKSGCGKTTLLNVIGGLDGIDAGEIAEGKIADCQLVDLNNVFLTPAYNLISNMVYSADSSCVDTVICDGKILMQNGVIPWEKETVAQARQVCADLIKR